MAATNNPIPTIPTIPTITDYYHHPTNYQGPTIPLIPTMPIIYSKDDYKQFREDLLEIAYVDEHSDLPKKKFRIHGCNGHEETLAVTIITRSRLGAVIAFADRDADEQMNTHTMYSLWHSLKELQKGDDIDKYVEIIIAKIFSNKDDTFLVEINEEIIIDPFSACLTKSATKTY